MPFALSTPPIFSSLIYHSLFVCLFVCLLFACLFACLFVCFSSFSVSLSPSLDVPLPLFLLLSSLPFLVVLTPPPVAGAPEHLEDAEEVRVSESLLLGLTDLRNNTRIPVGDLKPKRSPRKPNNEDDGTEVEDRNTVKSKADRLVSKKKKEIAGKYDEFGHEILQVPPASKGKGK